MSNLIDVKDHEWLPIGFYYMKKFRNKSFSKKVFVRLSIEISDYNSKDYTTSFPFKPLSRFLNSIDEDQ